MRYYITNELWWNTKYEQNMFAMSIIYYMIIIVNRKFGQFYGAFQS